MDLTGALAVTFIFGGGATVLLAMSPIGRAIADRIRGVRGGPEDRVRQLEDQVDTLVEDLETMRADFTDLQERLDFTERLLARDPQPQLPGSDNVQD